MAEVRIGTSGWHYDHWAGPFYPADSKPADRLDHYVRTFDSVEINNSFYQLPKRETLEGWRNAVPEGFLFAAKASRYTTHMKKLKDPQRATEKYFAVIDALGDKLGPILFQLPPNWACNPGRLRDFLAGMPEGYRYAFEFRDPSWFTGEVLDALAAADAAFCLYDIEGRQSPVEVTAGFVYIRLHGPGPAAYEGSYDDAALSGWADKIRGWRDEGRDVYCYFDNDQNAYAALNAARLKDLVS
jgi:uncharacterized protein YecE (DUF72 family)